MEGELELLPAQKVSTFRGQYNSRIHSEEPDGSLQPGYGLPARRATASVLGFLLPRTTIVAKRHWLSQGRQTGEGRPLCDIELRRMAIDDATTGALSRAIGKVKESQINELTKPTYIRPPIAPRFASADTAVLCR